MIIAKCRSWPYFDMSLFDFSWLMFTLQTLRILISALDFNSRSASNSVHDIDLLVYCQIIADIEDQNWSKVCRMFLLPCLAPYEYDQSSPSKSRQNVCLHFFWLSRIEFDTISNVRQSFFFGLVLSWTWAAPFSSRCIGDILTELFGNFDHKAGRQNHRILAKTSL